MGKLKKSIIALLLLFYGLIAHAQITPTAGTVYVTPDGIGDGSSWDNATADLQGAINATGVQKVYVATGNYNVGSSSFIMKNGVEIYGGFNPVDNTTDWDTRTLPNKGMGDGSVLNGKNERPVIWNDGNTLNSTAVLDGFTIKNGYHQDDAGGGIRNVSSSPILRNLVIKNNSAKYGGGMYNKYSSPVITNCIFTGNSVTYYGGGMDNVNSSSPTLTNCFFTGNSASGQGGAVYNLSGNGTFTNVTLAGNGGNGFIDFAGTHWQNSIIWDVVWYANSHTASNSLIQGANSTADGNLNATGMTATDIFYDPDNGDYTLKPASPAIDKGSNSLNTTPTDLAGNPRYNNGIIDLGAYEYREITPDPHGIIYVASSGTGNGRGWKYPLGNLQTAINTAGVRKVYVATGNYDVPSPNSFVMKNGVEIYGGFNPVNNITDWDNRTLPNKDMGDGSILHGLRERPVIWNVFTPETALNSTAVLDGFTVAYGKHTDNSGAGIRNVYASPTLRNLVIRNNEAGTAGGGIYNNSSSAINLSNAVIKDNTAQYGGGIYNNSSASSLTNVAIAGNRATLDTEGAGGGGIFNQSSALALTNVLITGNRTDFRGGGFRNLSGNPVLTNVTFANNAAVNNTTTAAMDIQGGVPQLKNSIIYGAVSGEYAARYTLIEGSSSTADDNLDATGITASDVFNYDFTLKSGSPAINKGSNALFSGLDENTPDLAGNTRLFGPAIDLGAYEYQGADALPVRWISFEGYLNDQRQAVLTWKTEETNVSHYEVERSADTRVFRIVNTVKSGKTGSYTLVDPVPASGKVYYRIRQVDTDGTFSHSRIISLASAGRNYVFAYPNPARDKVTVELDDTCIGSTVSLINMTGITLEQLQVKQTTLNLHMQKYAPGIYLLQMPDGKVLKLIRE